MNLIYKLFYQIIQALLYNKKLVYLRNFLLKTFPKNVLYSTISKSEGVELLRHYRNKAQNNSFFSGVIMMFDGKAAQPGLADCLRGIASVYYICKISNIPFKVYYKHPFDLFDYLITNEYDWTISDKEITYSKNEAFPVVCTSYNAIFGESNLILQKEYLLKKLKNVNGKQIHLYTNTFCYDEHFYDMFNELFCISGRLKKQIDYNLECLEGKYISASFRFATLLGDLKDTFGTPLPIEDRELLLKRCISAIEELHKSNLEYKKILVTTDSVSFANKIQEKLSYVYIIPGDVGHLAYNGSDKIVLKTFLDLLLISKAETVYMIRTEIMYQSGFAKRAALIGNKPFVEILI